MPRSRPSRSQRRKAGRRPQAPPAYRPAPPPPPVVGEAVETPTESAAESEPSVTKFSSRDYTYVQRELKRIIILGIAIIIAIVVISFFLP